MFNVVFWLDAGCNFFVKLICQLCPFKQISILTRHLCDSKGWVYNLHQIFRVDRYNKLRAMWYYTMKHEEERHEDMKDNDI